MVLSAHLWGAGGRGAIAIFMANLSMACVFSNVLTNSSACYYSPREGARRLWLQAVVWTLTTSALSAVLLFGGSEALERGMFFLTAVVAGMVTFHLSVFLGRDCVGYYNGVTVLQPLLLLVSMCVLHAVWGGGVECYYAALLFSYVVCLLVCHVLRCGLGVSLGFDFEAECLWRNVKFGLQEESGALLQFLNYRLPYYFLAALWGQASIGVFSVGVALGEAVWVVCRSISLVQYARLLKPGSEISREAVDSTRKFGLLSLLLSAFCLAVAMVLPRGVYEFVFGSEFGTLKDIVLYLSPGVLCVSVAKVYSHYFSATGRLLPLLVSSGCGALCSLVLSLWLIRDYGWHGACVATASAHVVCSVVTFVWFRRVAQDVSGGV